MVFLVVFFTFHLGFPVGSDGKESTCNAGDTDSILRSVRFPWRREWLCISIFLPGEFHGQRSLVGYNPWARKGSNTTEGLTLTFFFLCHLSMSSTPSHPWPEPRGATLENKNANSFACHVTCSNICPQSLFYHTTLHCAVLRYSVISDSVTPWTVAHQAPLSMGILQARLLEWVTISFSRRPSQSWNQTQISHIAGSFFILWATRESLTIPNLVL